jgi:hypothetical protein
MAEAKRENGKGAGVQGASAVQLLLRCRRKGCAAGIVEARVREDCRPVRQLGHDPEELGFCRVGEENIGEPYSSCIETGTDECISIQVYGRELSDVTSDPCDTWRVA